ncbi:MAG TPA: HEAT repeat domain-containing protein [Chryseosolibacter sp.]|nr:HEAT repeat domain-containing protein [Chryseosolibacter sp.]
MEKEKLEGLIIDYIDGRLNTVDRHLVEEELLNNADARKLYEELKEVLIVMEQSAPMEPSANLKGNFEKNLKAEIVQSTRGRTIFFRPVFYRAAAAVALMILSGAIGFWISKNNDQNARLAEIEKEMAITRKQLADTKNAMMGMLGNDQSASQRIRGVNVALELQQADNEIVNALLKTMQSDPNTNVRLAALEALMKFQKDPAVRKGLIDALSKQDDPMVQISIIQLMVQMKEKGVVKDLQKIVDDEGAMQAVKDEAYSGILKLS